MYVAWHTSTAIPPYAHLKRMQNPTARNHHDRRERGAKALEERLGLKAAGSGNAPPSHSKSGADLEAGEQQGSS